MDDVEVDGVSADDAENWLLDAFPHQEMQFSSLFVLCALSSTGSLWFVFPTAFFAFTKEKGKKKANINYK
jgi:hypothetical protein